MDKSDDTILSQFLSFTGSTDTEVARQFMEMSGNDLERAVGLFAEMCNGDNGGGGGGGGIGNDFGTAASQNRKRLVLN